VVAQVVPMSFFSRALWPWVVLWWPWLLAAALTGSAVLFGLWWLWWRLPKRQVDRAWSSIPDPKARADVEDNFRKTITQLVSTVVVLFGGTAALIGAWLAYSGTQQTIRVNADQARRSEQASHDLLISNQVSKGFEQLGNEKSMVVRLGGIYALEGVMNTSEEYHKPVLEALSAFVRDGTRTETGDGPPATDIQAALTVIGRRAAIGTGRPNLANAHIPKADLSGANLGGANLSGANLTSADLRDANLTSADLRGAHLSGANLSGANLTTADLRDADVTSANLRGADLTSAILEGANLTSAFLDGAVPRGAANLTSANLGGARLTRAALSYANLSGTPLLGRRRSDPRHPGGRQPDQRQPGPRQSERRLPGRRQPDQRPPAPRQPERRPPGPRQPERRPPGPRRPEWCDCLTDTAG
jgi:hypothetical protein